MGVNYNPAVVSSNMVLCLDAANPVSYPGANISVSLSQVEYLVVAGGGGGGSQDPQGGGGAGGYRSSVAGESSGGGASAESPLAVSPGSYTVTVGLGGLPGEPGAQGGNSVFGPITSIGGGGGGGSYVNPVVRNGTTGGSGGGGSGTDNVNPGTPGSAGTTGQGFAGGTGRTDNITFRNAGGGGGAGGVGGSGNTSNATGGTGGPGVSSSITGTAVTRAGGGAGGQAAGTAGGSGGGGAFNASGTANTGGGGGGAGGSGGSGIVIIRYPIRYPGVQQATGGTETTVGGFNIHTFTASGVFTVNSVIYPTWRDVSGQGNYGILVNNPTFSSANSGSIVFNGTTNYGEILTSMSSAFTGRTITVICWGKISSVVSKNTVLSFNGIFNFFMPGNRLGPTQQLYWDPVTSWKGSANTTWTVDQWYQFAWTITADRTLTFYTNGVVDSTTTLLQDFSPTSNTSVRVGFANAGEYATGNISSLMVYNTVLTADQINQNFQALRGRFGI